MVAFPAVSRIIPARAGFTPERDGPRPRGRDHPRSRGVYATSSTKNASSRGSSPLARGLQHIADLQYMITRIIPARAGFTAPARGRVHRAGDHPRSRGVYNPTDAETLQGLGSSPLARGLHGDCGVCVGCHGIIPARAGFTVSTAVMSCTVRDHPRSRGVYVLGPPFCSPCFGIIPARAGFTAIAVEVGCNESDHPRSRGVY